MKIGGWGLAKVGHYLQMVDNKATALSVAYDPSNAMSEAAFLHSPVTSAVSTNALAYQLRQGVVLNDKTWCESKIWWSR